MSWLKDLAGQAEGLLNQLDQSTGEVIEKAKDTSRTSLNVLPVTSGGARAPAADTQSLSGGYSPGPVPRSSGYPSSVSSFHARTGREAAQADPEQQLIDEFLNQDVPASSARSGASHSRRSSGSSVRSVPTFLQTQHAAEAAAEAARQPRAEERTLEDKGPNPARKARLEREIIELKAREADLTKAMAAKDSQLAVLRVRVAEAEGLVERKTELLRTLKTEKDRLLKDSASSSNVRDAALGTLQDQLKEAQAELEREKSQARRAEADYRSRITDLESQLSTVAHQLTQASKLHTEEKLRTSESSDELRLAKYNLEANKKEFDEYKSKAQRILAAKEKLIETLKSGGGSGEGGPGETEELRVELEELRSERDLAKEEASQTQLELYNLRTEMQELESSLAAESRAGLEAQKELQETLHSAQTTAAHYQDQLHHLTKQHQVLQDELRRQQGSVQAKLQEKDAEMLRLQSEASSRSLLSSVGPPAEADQARIRGLTENLIQKQMAIEGLQTEKNSLALQLERMETMYKEAEAAAVRSSSVGLPMGEERGEGWEEGLRSRVPAPLRETPYDSGLARGVKRAYLGLHLASLKGASFLRRYPAARTALLFYIACLHLWVFIVLLTYTPEVHSPDYHPAGPDKPLPSQ